MTKNSKKSKHIKMVGAVIVVAINTFILGNLKKLDFNDYTRGKSSGVNLVLAKSNMYENEKEATQAKEAETLNYQVIKTPKDLEDFQMIEQLSKKKGNNKKQDTENIIINKGLLNELLAAKKKQKIK